MPSNPPSDHPPRRIVGPIWVRDATLPFQLVGLFFAFVGVEILTFGLDFLRLPLTVAEVIRLPTDASVLTHHPASAAYHIVLGCFFLCSGLGIGGVRLRFER
ncbi:hypothetical protein [Haladaptatus salinisoli]|uniref:hypothetical protein n=1 Tax=Haladaptatus salinisoli TaxID=2884876 RepID=UPI001D09CF29|nr:hypothetical protein [Haladaptatus salinisoli]